MLRGSGIAAVALTDGQIDHAAGLLLLREGERLSVYSTTLVRDDLMEGFPVLRLLDHFCGVDWHSIGLDGEWFQLSGVDGIELRARGAMISTELMARLAARGARICEVSVKHFPRLAGEQSGANLKVIGRAFAELFALYRDLNSEGSSPPKSKT